MRAKKGGEVRGSKLAPLANFFRLAFAATLISRHRKQNLFSSPNPAAAAATRTTMTARTEELRPRAQAQASEAAAARPKRDAANEVSAGVGVRRRRRRRRQRQRRTASALLCASLPRPLSRARARERDDGHVTVSTGAAQGSARISKESASRRCLFFSSSFLLSSSFAFHSTGGRRSLRAPALAKRTPYLQDAPGELAFSPSLGRAQDCDVR